MRQTLQNLLSDRAVAVMFAGETLTHPGYFGVKQLFPPKENRHTFPKSP